MSKKIVKKLISVAAVACFALTPFTTMSAMTASAVTLTRSTDNDPIASG